MYDPEKPMGDPHSEAPGPEEISGDTDRTEEASRTWLPGPIHAELKLWGFDQVNGGQRNEAGTKGQCFFVGVREAMVAAGEGSTATALRRDVQQQLALPRWSLMADLVTAAAEGLLVGEEYRRPILGSVDPTRVDLTWRRRTAQGERDLPVVAQVLDRPIRLIYAGTVTPFVGRHLPPPPTAAEPLGGWIPVLKHRQ